MERPHVRPSRDKASSIGRVILPEELQEKAKPSKLMQKLFPVVNIEARALANNESTPARKSKRIAQRQMSSNSPLFALPPEIRGRILHYALMGVCVRFCHFNTTVCAMYGIRDGIDPNHLSSPETWWCYSEMQPGLPAWMQLDKQVLFEGVKQFHRKAIFFHMNDLSQPLFARIRPLGLLRFDQARIVHLAGPNTCYMRTWQESDEQGHRYSTVGQHPEEEAILKQSVYHLASSPTLQILSLDVTFGWSNYDKMDPSVQDLRSSFAYLKQLPKSLQKVTFELGEMLHYHFLMCQPGFLRIKQFTKDELRRIGKALVSGPGALSVEATVCTTHGLTADACSNASGDDFVWSLTVTSAAYRRAKSL